MKEIKDPFKVLSIIGLSLVLPVIIYTSLYNGSEKQAIENYERALNEKVFGKIILKERDDSNRGFKVHLNTGVIKGVWFEIYSAVEVGDSIYKKEQEDTLYVKKSNDQILKFDVVNFYKEKIKRKKSKWAI